MRFNTNEKEKMKKLLLILIMVSFIVGCASFKKYENQDAEYVNWSHMKFSIWGYKNPTDETLEKSIKEGWWGEPIPYIPAK